MVQFLCQITCTNLFREKNCPVFYAFFKITTVLTKIFYFFPFHLFLLSKTSYYYFSSWINQTQFHEKKPNCCLNILLVLLHRNFNIFRWITQPPSELYIFPWKSCNLHRKVVNYQRYGRYFRPSSEYSSYNFFRRRQSQKCR